MVAISRPVCVPLRFVFFASRNDLKDGRGASSATVNMVKQISIHQAASLLLAALKPAAKFDSLFRSHRGCITKRHGLAHDSLGEDLVAVLPK